MFRLAITSRGSYIQGFLHSGVLTSRGCYIQGFLRSGVLTSRGSYDQGFLHPGVLTIRGSYIQGSFDQGLLHPGVLRLGLLRLGVLTIWCSYVQGFLHPGILTIRCSYVQGFLHLGVLYNQGFLQPRVVHLRLYKEGELYKDVFVTSRGRCYIQGYAQLLIMIRFGRTILVSGQLQLRTFLSRPEGVRLRELRLYSYLRQSCQPHGVLCKHFSLLWNYFFRILFSSLNKWLNQRTFSVCNFNQEQN